MTGKADCCHWSLRVSAPASLPAQPPAAMQVLIWPQVISVAEAANDSIVARHCGPSLSLRSFSVSGEPIMNSPPGRATISGQLVQSRNLRSETSPPASAAMKAAVRRRLETSVKAGAVSASGEVSAASPALRETELRAPCGTADELTGIGWGAAPPLQPAKQKSAPVRPEL